MDKDLPNFPLLFERIWQFFRQCDELREKQSGLTPNEFVREFDKLIKGNSPVGFDEAFSALKEIVITMYGESAVHCSGSGTRMRA
jgi:hypothetical protein